MFAEVLLLWAAIAATVVTFWFRSTAAGRRPTFPLHPNVAGQAAEGQAEAFDEPDHGCHQD